MNHVEDRLVHVFQTVFPNMTAEQARQATQDSVPDWDSVAAITLMNVIEEEFAIELDFDRAAELNSFPSIVEYLKSVVTPAA